MGEGNLQILSEKKHKSKKDTQATHDRNNNNMAASWHSGNESTRVNVVDPSALKVALTDLNSSDTPTNW